MSKEIKQEGQDMNLFVFEYTSRFKQMKRITYQYSSGVVVQENNYTELAKAIDERYQKIEDALRELVGLKKIKDRQGKTTFYNMQMPIAWQNAIEALKQSEDE